ncbi:inositol monophosphatase family protein [Mariprofundus sp. EBB-1]|uniref:inositol monophosphatase family protein n=1 Tax=Mariprofundus sp. EBB-1 TaxID=2650971 RepID=UPI000EF1A567|nr:inositol monophosphatase family protein [Mariprofundus sp. EBB-1]RLL53708.1 inositol monophosphatase family protein [Mariprofundus sp. EBB-1]
MTQKKSNITLQSLIHILQQAGREIVLPGFHTSIQTTQKTDGSVVTEIDLACQQFIEKKLTELDSSIAFLGEEMSESEQLQCLKESHGRYWCLDPLDGTTNFVANVPGFAISLALIESGVPQMACIYDPVRQETFSAARHAGAHLNNQAIRCAPVANLDESVGYIDFKRLQRDTAISMACDRIYRSQRNIGSCALEWAWLAAGRGHFIVHGGEKIWDFAAGSLLVQEAGGRIGDFSGQSLFPCHALSSPILATCNPTLQAKLQAKLNPG